ncbi:LysR substrate-binding domain-containing protein [Hoeflea sp. TYP-13]|uniref:LysR substrate-binding domain-containing protein n=1 Tax=Hoeflea sp. TYP-13 TaxID=3230023 RepID=UPI0034C6ACA3
MARSLPPFAALRAFEAAARHCSFKQAAEELNLSPSAISHQIKSLEDYLGVCLFQRTRNALELTDLAQAYWSDVAAAMNILEAASSRVEKERDDASLVINLFPSLVSTWFLPRLNTFKSENRDVDIRIVSSLDSIPFTGSDIDVAIRYSEHKPAEVMSAFLFKEEIVPVCSPSYVEEYGPFANPQAILEATLIYCINHPTEWTGWFREAGLEEIVPARRMDMDTRNNSGRPLIGANGYAPAARVELDNRALVIEAARDGLGIAMARTPYADRYLRNGNLVIPFDLKIKTGMNYYLCWPERKAKFPNVRNFCDWLVSTLDAEQDH